MDTTAPRHSIPSMQPLSRLSSCYLSASLSFSAVSHGTKTNQIFIHSFQGLKTKVCHVSFPSSPSGLLIKPSLYLLFGCFKDKGLTIDRTFKAPGCQHVTSKVTLSENPSNLYYLLHHRSVLSPLSLHLQWLKCTEGIKISADIEDGQPIPAWRSGSPTTILSQNPEQRKFCRR